MATTKMAGNSNSKENESSKKTGASSVNNNRSNDAKGNSVNPHGSTSKSHK